MDEMEPRDFLVHRFITKPPYKNCKGCNQPMTGIHSYDIREKHTECGGESLAGARALPGPERRQILTLPEGPRPPFNPAMPAA